MARQLRGGWWQRAGAAPTLTPMTALPSSYEGDLARMVAEWDLVAVGPARIAQWANEVERLRAEQARLRAAGVWRSGGRTLLHAFGAPHDEVLMRRGHIGCIPRRRPPP